MPSFRGSSQQRNWTHVSYGSCMAHGFFTYWAIWITPFPSYLPPKPPDSAATATRRVPSWRIPLGKSKLFSLCSRDITLHFVWVIYILEHTCEFSMWNLRTQLSPFPRSQIGIYFLLSEWINMKKISLYWPILVNISCSHFGKIISSIFSIFFEGLFLYYLS